MLDGWLVVNRFLVSDKFSELYDWLLRAADSNDMNLRLIHNDELLIDLQDEPDEWDHPAFCLFWDKDIRLAEYIESKGVRLFNRSRAIELCDDKGKTHLALAAAGLAQPRTIIAPMTFANIGYTDLSFIDEIIEKLGLPLIIKHTIGSFGGQVFLANNREQVVEVLLENRGAGFLFQQYIDAFRGSDLRLQVVGGKVIGAMKRSAREGEFRANLTLGGSMEKWIPDQKQINLALAACACLELDFAGVDLLIDSAGQPLVCEVNSNAHFKTLFECAGVDTADAIMKHIRKNR